MTSTSKIWMPICTQCKQECELGSSYIAATSYAVRVAPSEGEDKLLALEFDTNFEWGCEHRPVLDADAYFGSVMCLHAWVYSQPDSQELCRKLASFFSHSRKELRCLFH